MRYYSVWYVPSDRWTRAYYSANAKVQIPSAPFLLTYEQAQKWCHYLIAGNPRYHYIEYEVREVPNAEEIRDQQRREAHADKYL